MWSFTSDFLAAISTPQRRTTTVTVALPGGSPQPLVLSSGTWSFTSGQTIRRTAQLVIDGGIDVYRALCTPGAVIRVAHGFRWAGGRAELVPVITGELSQAAKQHGDGTISITVNDLGQRLVRATYLASFSPDVSLSRIAAMTAAVNEAVPAATVAVTAGDLGTIAVANTWSSRADLVNDLATDGNAEAFFTADGNFLIRNVPTVSDPAVYLVKRGVGGTLKSFGRQRPLDKLYNTVIVLPASADGSQTWTSQIAQISDPANPRHPDYIGVSPYTWTAPTVMTSVDALTVAETLLTQVQGSTETLALEALSNAALDGGDVIRITDMDTGEIVNHIIDSGSGDLVTGAMSLATRAAFEVAA